MERDLFHAHTSLRSQHMRVQCRDKGMRRVARGLQAAGLAIAAALPAKVVEQCIEAHLQGHFVTSRSFILARVHVGASLGSNWLFGPRGTGSTVSPADLCRSRTFPQVCRYTSTGTTPTGDKQVTVDVVRSSLNLAHLYPRALAPKRGSTPSALIDAVDASLTHIPGPVEASRRPCVLVRGVDSRDIRTIFGETCTPRRQPWQGRTPRSAAGPLQGPSAPTERGGAPRALPGATTTSSALGRPRAAAPCNAMLQGFHRASQGLPPAAGPGSPTQPKQDKDEPGFFEHITRALFGSQQSETKSLSASMDSTFTNIRDALACCAVRHGSAPETSLRDDWQSLRRVVNQYGKPPLPATDEAAGLTLVQYKPALTRDRSTLWVDLRAAQDGATRVDIHLERVDHGN